MPTLLDACGCEPRDDVDGISFLGDLKGKPNPMSAIRPLVIQAHRGDRPVRYHNFMIRQANWKLLHNSGFGKESFAGEPKFELFDLKKDPLEQRNVVTEHPEVVADLKRKYDEWFEDVGSTRPDNYAPPRIHVGTPHENPTTLTRQDWRHLAGRPWAQDSLGFWMLDVKVGRRYDIECRFAANDQEETLSLHGWQLVARKKVPAGATSVVLENVLLQQGPVDLRFELSNGERIRGVHQVDIRLR